MNKTLAMAEREARMIKALLNAMDLVTREMEVAEVDIEKADDLLNYIYMAQDEAAALLEYIDRLMADCRILDVFEASRNHRTSETE